MSVSGNHNCPAAETPEKLAIAMDSANAGNRVRFPAFPVAASGSPAV